MKPAPIIVFLLLAACAHGPRQRLVVVEAKGESLLEAQKRAIEQVRGVSVWGRTKVAEGRVVEQRLSAGMGGIIARYRVLEESPVVRIRAWVSDEGTSAAARAAAGPPRPFGDPKVFIDVAGAAGRGVRQGLVESGFSLVEAREGCDLRVSATLSIHSLGQENAFGFRSQRARLSTQAHGHDGRLLAQESQEASAIDPVDSSAADKASESAGLKAGRALGRRLLAVLGS